MIIINQQVSPKALVVWLHGLGSDKNDFVHFIKRLNLNEFTFILPNAPFRKISINQGYEMRGWYDIYSLDFKTQDDTGLNESKCIIESIIQSNYKIFNKPKLHIGGFSQGAALAQYIGLSSKFEFTKIVSLSGYLPKLAIPFNKSSKKILAIHGTHDEIININLAKQSYEKYKINENFILKEYKMSHEVIEEEVLDVQEFFLRD